MNIFATDSCPIISARNLCDQHVIKMTLETAQMLCTATGMGPYKPTHKNHPCVEWLRLSRSNSDWLLQHGRELGAEYTFRFNKRHASSDVIDAIWDRAYAGLEAKRTPFVQCVPDDLLNAYDTHAAYRQCLIRKSEEWKAPMRYTRRSVPFWLNRYKLIQFPPWLIGKLDAKDIEQ